MAIRDTYINPQELQQIVFLCEELTRIRIELENELDVISVNLFEESDGEGKTFEVRDSNGDILGHVGYGDNGYALYIDDGDE